MSHAEKDFADLVKYLRSNMTHHGCHPAEDEITCLVRIQPLYLNKGSASGTAREWHPKSHLGDGYTQCEWGPTADGETLPDLPFDMLQRHGTQMAVPVLLGSNRDDGGTFLDGCPNGEVWVDGKLKPSCNMTRSLYDYLVNELFYGYNTSMLDDPAAFPDDMYKTWLAANFLNETEDQGHVAHLYNLYNTHSSPSGGPGYKTNYYAAESLIGDFLMYCPERLAAGLLARSLSRISQKHSVFQFTFDHTPVLAPFANRSDPTDFITYGPGACHGCEIPFVFHRDDSDEYGLQGAPELQLSRLMSQYWTNFAWHGDVNNAAGRWAEGLIELPQWDAYQHHVDGAMTFATAPDGNAPAHFVTPHPHGQNCVRFWQPYYMHKGWLRPPHAT